MAFFTLGGIVESSCPGLRTLSIWIVKQHRNALFPQRTSQSNCLRGPPTVAIDNNARPFFLVGRTHTVAVCVEELEYLTQGLLPVMVCKHHRMNGGVGFAQERRSPLRDG